MGVVNITSCLFSHSGVSGEQEAMYGGGGLVIEVNDFTSQSSCIITNSTQVPSLITLLVVDSTHTCPQLPTAVEGYEQCCLAWYGMYWE